MKSYGNPNMNSTNDSPSDRSYVIKMWVFGLQVLSGEKTLKEFRSKFPKYDMCELMKQMGVPHPGVQVFIKTFILMVLGSKIPSYLKAALRYMDFVFSKTHAALGYTMLIVCCIVGFNDYYSNTRNKLYSAKELLEHLEHCKQMYLTVYNTKNCDHLIPFVDALVGDVKDSQPKSTILQLYELSIKKAIRKKLYLFEGIFSEHCAKFCLRNKLDSSNFFTNAIDAFKKWGAEAKVTRLAEMTTN